MSSDFYFRRWREVLSHLQMIVSIDVDFQTTKAHDKTLCEAMCRLTGITAQYLAVYKDVLECVQFNLQVQKTRYLEEVCKTLMERITELMNHLKKLEATDYQFFNSGLINNKLINLNIEIDEVPSKPERAENVQEMLDEAFKRVAEKQRLIEEQKALEEKCQNEKPVDFSFWDDEFKEEEEAITTFEENKNQPTEEQLEIRRLVNLIQAQERQAVLSLTQQRNKREKWTKELEGRMPSPAPLEVRERSARLIQKILRKYFEVKRQRIIDGKKDELLNLRFCFKPKSIQLDDLEKIKDLRTKIKRKYDAERDDDYEKMKQKLLIYRRDDIIEHYRDCTRDWFRLWYDEIKFINDIPDEKEGGIAAILNGETPDPQEWLEEYKKYIANKISNKDKSASDLKFAKQEEKRLRLMEKRDQAMKVKLQEQLLIKMMKNPTLHPGFDYPQSNEIDNLIKAIEQYHQVWDYMDITESDDVKKRFIKGFDCDDVCSNINKQLAEAVVEDMRQEQKLLKKALKVDYENLGEHMPEAMAKKKKKEKKVKLKKPLCEDLMDKIEDLVSRGVIKNYDKIKLKDFMGDPNFAGDNLICDYRPADPFHGETRHIWWEKCREMDRGFQKILLVGPELSGKTLLVHALASINDAVLFELNPMNIPAESINVEYLDPLVNSVCICAKALQPSVIYIRQIQKLYYRKVPPEEANINFILLKKYFITKLFKKISKQDKITVIGACLEPWVTKSNLILKHFPSVVMMPNTSYSVIVELLKDWVISNNTIPPEIDVNSLAFVLRRFTIGYIKQALKDFLTAERLVHIKAYGLSPLEIYNFILENEIEEQIDHTKYKKWYTEKTVSGQKEMEHFNQQAIFKEALDLFNERSKKSKPKSAPSSAASSIK